MVLLKNDGVLPLRKGTRVAVVGPQGVARGLLSDYAGNDRNANTCMTRGQPSYDCLTTIADAIARVHSSFCFYEHCLLVRISCRRMRVPRRPCPAGEHRGRHDVGRGC